MHGRYRFSLSVPRRIRRPWGVREQVGFRLWQTPPDPRRRRRRRLFVHKVGQSAVRLKAAKGIGPPHDGATGESLQHQGQLSARADPLGPTLFG